MNMLLNLIKAVALSLLLAGSALAADKVNINTADATALSEALVNVGPAKAQAIVEYRQANGPFKSADELAMVKGIGLKTVERNRDRIEVGNAPAAGNKPTQARKQEAAAAETAPKPRQLTRR